MLHDSSSNPLDGMSDFERQLQEFFDELKAMIMMGNKHDAIDLLQANYEAVKEQMNAGTKGIEEIAILDVIALGYMGIGDLKFVQSLLDMVTSFPCMFNYHSELFFCVDIMSDSDQFLHGLEKVYNTCVMQ